MQISGRKLKVIMLNASESIEDCTYIVHLQRVIMNSHNNHSPVGLVAQLYIDLHLSRVTMNSHNDPPPVDLIGQLVEHCAECLGIDRRLHIYCPSSTGYHELA